MTVRAVADELGWPFSTYASYENKYKGDYLPMNLVRPLIKVFGRQGIDESKVLALAGLPVNQAGSSISALNPPNLRVIPNTEQTLDFARMPRDLPIIGIAACGNDGAFEMNGQTVDYARRPQRLASVRDAYALYVDGESMMPWREHGALVFVHPHQPVNVGDYVVVQMHPASEGEPTPAYIKRLVRRTARDVILLQYHPRKEIALKTAQILAIHRIMDWSELLGL